ncbi:unnamed protein product [Vitrella brassicaformis CCMP3155]|uniref:RRM domain-containing protein n=2 Tax=Vitrella brassicaformis TaxID=1169539 RepID=A0A0G4EZ03_VITBC|nr:unnamed protein product [Vitrella brassicaformis CCMP3155]|mmetsp:Transcript_16261/g.38905  ORF Transcript_16261/g.38905 Transcript_16261/m.38905 type:complete len:237 (+) Transcript_16261:68-778(+)|eukprot:CEM04418.1 unnamed protein product [Vitrella brassicaformis CCMP3155]
MVRNDSARIYIGNLPDDVRESELDDVFYKFGRIVDIEIKTGRTSNGTAYAFVEFSDPRDAGDAVEMRDGMRFGGNRLKVQFTGERRPRRNGPYDGFRKGSNPPKRTEYRVIVEGLPDSASWQDLKDHMRSAGAVGYANVEHGKGIVEYEREEDMLHAIKRLNGSTFKNPFSSGEIRVFEDREGRGGEGHDAGRDADRDRDRDNRGYDDDRRDERRDDRDKEADRDREEQRNGHVDD